MKNRAYAALAVAAMAASAAHAQRYCVYDPVGTQGTFYAMAKDYALAAKGWGASLELKAYT
ncbi:MAG: hypothetical protein VW625_03400, partial [Perlucidibaca sp.]